jgi:nucleotide-binding universal stress UspA family protein
MDVLIPTDGSNGARRGIDAGIELARRENGRVHLLYVVDERRHGGPETGYTSGELFIEKSEDEALEHLESVLEEAKRRGVHGTIACARGRPDSVILDYANEHDVDRILMGIHGLPAGDWSPKSGTIGQVRRSSSVPVETV